MPCLAAFIDPGAAFDHEDDPPDAGLLSGFAVDEDDESEGFEDESEDGVDDVLSACAPFL